MSNGTPEKPGFNSPEERIFNDAKKLFDLIKTDPEFDHAGPDSRGIVVSTPNILDQFSKLAVTHPDMKPVIADMGRLLTEACDIGTYIRIKGGDRFVDIDIAGCENLPVGRDPTYFELDQIVKRRSGIKIMAFLKDQQFIVNIFTNSYGINHEDGREIEDVINPVLFNLRDPQRLTLAQGILSILSENIIQSGEFPDTNRP
jgi:hypothetical protein